MSTRDSGGEGGGGDGGARYDALRRLRPAELDDLAERLGDSFYVRGRGAAAEQAVDIAGLCGGDEGRQRIVDDFVRQRGAGGVSLLDTYLQWVCRELDRVPIFHGEGGEGRLSAVHVRLLQRPLAAGGAPAAGAELTLSELLDREPRGRWTLQGDPGAGKTTELRHLAMERAALRAVGSSPASVPVLMGLPALGEALGAGSTAASPFAHAAAEVVATVGYERLDPGRLVDALEAEARAGRVLLLLDGLDEVRPEHIADVRELLTRWERHLSECALVVTSRRFGYHRLSTAFGELELLPLPWEQQRELLVRWLGEGQADAVLAQVARHPPLQDMAGNPLVLALMAFVARERAADPATRDQPLPGRRLELYREVLRCYCKGCAREEPRPRLLVPPEDLRAALGALALSLLQDHSGPWTREELERHIAGVAPLARLAASARRSADDGDGEIEARSNREERSLVADIAADTGLLVPADRAKTCWAFRHRSLLECLAAEALHAGGPRAIRSLARRVSGDRRWWHLFAGPGPDQAGRWAEVFALLAGMSDDPVAFLRDLRRAGSERLALRALANVPDLPPEVLIAELGVAGSLELVRELMARIGERDQLVARLAELFRVVADPEGRAYVAAALLAVGAEQVAVDLLPDGVSPADVGLAPRPWALVPAGTFWMGSPESEEGRFQHEGPRHEVTLTQAYEMLATPVTQALYAVVTGTNPSRFTAEVRRPVERVSWEEAQRFCARLGELQGREVRLPTEAQWEHACRADSEGRWYFGDDEARLGEYAWFAGNSGSETHPVGALRPNKWGLQDMHGNVWEWCLDDGRTYQADPVVDPLGELDGARRAVRGGSAWVEPRDVRSAFRSWDVVELRFRSLGFRCVRSPLRQP